MKLNNIWGYGQLFGLSAIDGPNRHKDDFVLMTMRKPFSFRIELPHPVTFSFKCKKIYQIKALMSDFIDAKISNKKFFMTFFDNDTLVGKALAKPTFKGEGLKQIKTGDSVNVYECFGHYFAFLFENGRFVISHSSSAEKAIKQCNDVINCDFDNLLKAKYAYYRGIKKCKDKKYEQLYYKALSINKVNIKSPEGLIKMMWTTPDRVPHRHMWLWDSAFHALGMVTYNKDLAEEIILAMLSQIRDDGFLPHMANPYDSSYVTQPCVMSWACFNIYKVTKNKEFLKKALPFLEKYLSWDLKNRDKNNNGLLEWYTEPDYKECKCGESGLDNSPRFDFDEDMDAIDFSSYLALDTLYLSLIYKELGNSEKASQWKKIHIRTKNAINDLMYSKAENAYFDRLFSGKLTNVLTPSSFLPLFVGITPKERVEGMVERLIDKDELWAKLPLSSISQKDPRYSNDMWRGASWLNINYFIIVGLKRYGYDELAEKLREKTLKIVNKWYKKTGVIFEFYDSMDKASPFNCLRKGEGPKIPDYRKHVHSISDYNWSACFTLLLIQNKYYF